MRNLSTYSLNYIYILELVFSNLDLASMMDYDHDLTMCDGLAECPLYSDHMEGDRVHLFESYQS